MLIELFLTKFKLPAHFLFTFVGTVTSIIQVGIQSDVRSVDTRKKGGKKEDKKLARSQVQLKMVCNHY